MTLVEHLKVVLANVVTLKFKAHGYHWNVEGPLFAEFHALFETIYTDIDESIDPFAENIRKLGDYAPYKLSTFQAITELPETSVTTNPIAMASDLLIANDQVVECLMEVFDQANDERQQGVANFVAERIDAHQKWSWQLRVSTKNI